MIYETVVDWEYEQKCSTSYEEECHGYGYHQQCDQVTGTKLPHSFTPKFIEIERDR